MTALRMKVLGWFAAFVLALVVGDLAVGAWVITIGANAGGLFEGLSIINMSETAVAALPGGLLFAGLLTNPTYRAFTAVGMAASLGLLEAIAVHQSVRLLRIWAEAKTTSIGALARTHAVDVACTVALILAIGCGLMLEVQMWASRAHADIALAASGGRKAAWMAMTTGAGETVAEAATRLAQLGAIGFFAVTLGLAVALEAVGRTICRTGQALADAIDAAKKSGLADRWLDTAEWVIRGGEKEAVTRRTAIANPDRWFLHRSGRVYDRAWVERMRGLSLKKLGAILLVTSLAVASAHASETVSARQPYEPPAMFLHVLLDLSQTTAKTQDARVAFVRRTFGEIANTTAEADVRRSATTRFVIQLVSVDAFGGEILWRGDERTLGELTDAWWKNTLASRRTYVGCSQFAEGWKQLQRFAAAARQCDPVFVLSLSDLVVEEVRNGSTSRCQPKMFGPSAEVPWDVLARATTRAYWVPDAVKRGWEGPLRTRGLSDRVKMYATPDPGGRAPLPIEALLASTACVADAPVQTATLAPVKRGGLIALTGIAVVTALLFLLARN